MFGGREEGERGRGAVCVWGGGGGGMGGWGGGVRADEKQPTLVVSVWEDLKC